MDWIGSPEWAFVIPASRAGRKRENAAKAKRERVTLLQRRCERDSELMARAPCALGIARAGQNERTLAGGAERMLAGIGTSGSIACFPTCDKHTAFRISGSVAYPRAPQSAGVV